MIFTNKVYTKVKDFFNLKFISENAENSKSYFKARVTVSIFYSLQVVLAFIHLMKIGAVDPERTGFLPIWPMAWAGSLPYSDTALIVALFYLFAAFAGCLFWNNRISRIIVFLGIFQVHALDSSFGYINHFYYLLLYACFIFIFLPDTTDDVLPTSEKIKSFLVVYWGVIAAILVTYTLSGMWKIYWGIVSLVAGHPGSFSPFTFSEHVAKKTIIESRDYFFSGIVISNPFLSWPAYLGTIYIEFFSIWAAFKPSLHKLWGLILMFLHVGILLVMGIPFFESLLVLSVLLINSPFATEKINMSQIFKDLPIIGYCFGVAQKVFKLKAI